MLRSTMPTCGPILLVPLLTCGITFAQDDRPSFPKPTASILLLGTFHFKDAGLDGYKPKFDIDIQSPERQKQIEELVDRLAAWKPTRVAVEAKADRQEILDERYSAFVSGSFDLPSNEIYQLGFRLAKKLELPGVWAVDAEGRYYEPWVDPDKWAQEHDQRRRLDPLLELAYRRWYRWKDEQKTRETLGETLLRINTEERLLLSHGHTLIDSFEVGDSENYPGVDSKTAWYNRNLKIFANLQRLKEKPGERILLIIGVGHVPILRHAVQASPEYELVEVSDVLSGARQ